MAVIDPGLCARCRWTRRIRTRRGADFWLCSRAEVDDKFPKYPRLPVDICSGYERIRRPSGADAETRSRKNHDS